ncbi:hypothetical protein [Nocardia higoensis]|nr:hypothetical protein [Nocardia higoensis]
MLKALADPARVELISPLLADPDAGCTGGDLAALRTVPDPNCCR